MHPDSPQTRGVLGDWLYQGQECECDCPLDIGKERNFAGVHFWARGYAVSPVGFNEEQVRKYIREQEGADGSGRF